jgi:hypothetical protein
MIYLTEISLPRKAAIDATMTYDPLVASDMDYCVKTWMANQPSLACRPWRASFVNDGIRISGWRREAPISKTRGAYLGVNEVALSAGSLLALAGRFIPLRRVKSVARDAAAGRADPMAAYEAWLRERLIDVMPHAAIDNITIEGFHQRRVLRKVVHERERTRVREEVIPVVDATVLLTVRVPVQVEDWLASGVGPQKAFGYGAFIPTVDPREANRA